MPPAACMWCTCSDLYDFLDEPRHGLQTALGDGGLDGVEEDAVVGLGQLDAGKQVRDDAFEQRHVLTTFAQQPERMPANAYVQAKLVAWHSGRTSVSDWRTFPVLRSTCS